ncbi:hypothetical protein OUZ56_021507, partial [Daphnia magna]
MKHVSDRRRPSCAREPSRRLHPISIPITAEDQIPLQSNINIQTVRPVTTPKGQNLSPASSDSSSSDSDDTDHNVNNTPHNNRGPDMATPIHKFIPPPSFSAKPGENAVDWLDRYELTGKYNRWGDDELRSNFVMYLEGTARKWFLFSKIPATWRDQPGQAAAQGAAAVPATQGLRTIFLQEFKQENYALVQETLLRQRMQGPDEDAASYNYDIIHMCHLVNPTMTQAQQLEHLYNGLKKSL